MRRHDCYDLIPNSSKIVIFDTRLPVKKAFFALVANGNEISKIRVCKQNFRPQSSTTMEFRSTTICWHAHYFRFYQVSDSSFLPNSQYLKSGTLSSNHETFRIIWRLIIDVFSILQTYYRSPSKRMHELEDHLIETWRNLIAERKAKSENTRATLSRDIGMISISPDDRYIWSLFLTLEKFYPIYWRLKLALL